MNRLKRLVAILLVMSALTAFAPAVYADAGGGPGSNNGCPGHQPPHPPNGGCG
jgi:hypothetical protein